MSEPQYDGQDMNDYYEFQELRECRRTLQQLRERIEQLPRYTTLQRGGWIGDPDGEMVSFSDVLKAIGGK